MLTDRSRIARTNSLGAQTRRALCSSLAIATALIVGSGIAHAQTAPSGSFQGNGTFNSGTGGITTSTGTTTISITSPNAVIDWTTFDTTIGGGPIIFQPSSTTATFQSTGNFSVLNRILPTDPSRAVQFNGNVVSQIQGTTTTPGGTVYFYSPGGVIVGSTAVFNVGNLGLTSAAPQVVGGVFEQTNPVTGAKFVNFTAANSGTGVMVQPGAQITSSVGAAGSYVAIVAPVVSQRGTINVNGVAALVSADAATITFNPSGLFDIQVTSGTSGNLGGFNSTLSNDGTITGPAFSGTGAVHRVYMVAVPKNTAITLAINSGSTLGFAIAGAADVVGNAVVLSAGQDIIGGNIASSPSAGGGSGAADLNIGGTTLNSALTGSSTRDASLFSSLLAPTSHAYSKVSLRGDTSADIAADGAGTSVTIDGAVALVSDKFGGSAIAGTAQIFAQNGGAVSIGAPAMLLARGFGSGGSSVGSTGGTGTGGIATIQATSGGTVNVMGQADLNTIGFGGAAFTAGGNGGAGVGGRSQVFASGASSNVTIGGALNALALGIGGNGINGAGAPGTGGQAFVNAQSVAGASIHIGGAAQLNAYGIGGNANGGNAGSGFGGVVTTAASSGNDVSFLGSLDLFGGGQGGVSTGGNAGSATGGNARITLFSGGTMSVGGNAQVHGLALGGRGNPSSALATGNLAAVSVQQNSTLNIAGSLSVFATGLGDRSFVGSTSNSAGIGGAATVDAFTNGAINVGGVLRVRADATSTNGLNASAGSATLAANSGGDITSSQLNVTANGVGGADTGSGAGFGTGGSASVFASGAGSTINVANGNSTGVSTNGDLDFLSASGFGGMTNGGGSGVGGAATGGTVNLSATAGGVISGPANTGTQGAVRIIARATGGNANAGVAGGQATGGIININIDNASFTSANLLPSSFAQGGSATASATGTINGGNALGGQRNISVRNGATATTSFGGGGPGAQGGNATASGRGGDASGGSASLVVDNATLMLSGPSVVFSQNQSGSGGTAGNVTAGTAFTQVSNGGTLTVPDDVNAVFDFAVISNAFGPAAGSLPGTSQGTVTAGTATLLLQGGTINGPGSISVQAGAAALSDQYTQGGTYQGGQASLQLQGGTISSPTIHVSANAEAGAVGAGLTGTGGSATGGSAFVQASGATTNLTGGQIVVEAAGLGGNVLGTGTGGDGTGGVATLRAVSAGVLNVSGNAILTAEGIGGSASGTASSGAGGAGAGGSSRLLGNAGTVTVNGTTQITSSGLGGNGASGGAGGIGVGGFAGILALSNVARSSTVSLGAVTIGSDGTGGFGGTGNSGGGAGGAGGTGTGGNTQALGAAGNGNLTTGSVVATALGIGGAGGAGGVGATGGAGGAGGRGLGGFIQVGTASFLDISPTNTGSGTFGSLAENSSALGGNGGTGGSGTTQGSGGNGGAAFDGSSIVLVRGSPVTFGGAVTLTANATGGNGGAGSTAGIGGNATVGTDPVVLNSGGIGVTLTNRFQHPEQPGRLSAGTVTGVATAIGGSGSTAGASLLADQPIRVEITNSTATINTLDLRATAATPLAGATPSTLAMTNATASISNLTFNTGGTLSLALDTATLNTANLTLSAANFVLPATRPGAFGTFNVSNSISVTTALDFLAYANFNLGFNAALSVVGSIQVGDVIVNGTLQAASGAQGTLTAANVSATSVALQGTAGLTTGAITSPGAVTLRSLVSITTGAIQAGSLDARTNGTLATQAITSSGLVSLASAGSLSTGPISASSITAMTAQTFASGNLAATETIDIGSIGNATVGTLQAGQLAKIRSSASILAGDITAGGSVDVNANGQVTVGNVLAGIVNPSTIAGEKFSVAIGSIGGPVTIGNIGAQGYVSVGSGLALTTGSIAGKDLLGLVGNGPASFGAITTGTYNSSSGTYAPGGRVLIELGSQFTLGGSIDNYNPELVFAATALPAPGAITVNGAVSTGSFRANTSMALTVAAISATGSIELAAGGAITAGQLTAGNNVQAKAGGAITVAGASAGIVNPSTVAGADYTIALRSLASITAGALTARANVGLSSPGAISVGNISANQIILVLAGTGLTTGSISTLSSGRTYLANFSMEALGGQITQSFDPAPILAASPASIAGPIVVGAVSTGTFQAATGQAFSSGNIATAGFTKVIADGSLTTGSVSAGQSVGLQSGAALSTGAVQAGDAVGIAASGAVTTGNVSAGIVNASTNPAATYKIAIASQTGAVTTGTLTARRDIGLQAAQGIATGDIAGRDVLLLAGTGVTTGAILAGPQTQPTGRVYIGNFSMATQTSNVFSPFSGPLGSLPIFNLQPVRIGGPITIGGAVVAGSLFAAAAQGISLQAVTTPGATTQTGSGGFIDLDSGGTVTVNGRLAAGRRIDIASRDIDITESGSIDALGPNGEILLASNNPNGAFVGEGLTTTGGYMLSNAEYARLKGGQIAVVGIDQTELATDLTIGTLTINASQLYGANGNALFASGNRTTQTPSGIVRIVGAVTASGFGATNEIDLLAGTVELEAEKGSLKIDNGSGGLGGQIMFEADHVHVASDAILTKLRADPLYVGHIKELNAPALIQRTDGVLNALNLDFSSKSQTVYVQNTGSVAVPAGIVTRLDSNMNTSNTNNNTTNTTDGVRPPGGSEFVINGQIQTSTGIVTGNAAFELIIASLKAEAVADGKTFASDLTPTSTFNGCVVTTGVCAFGNADPVAALSSEITVVTNATLDESPVAPAADDSDEGDDGSGDKDDEDSKSDEGSSPIAPPAPLISTRALDGNVNVVEPVSGAGNPALFGSAVDETTAEGEKP